MKHRSRALLSLSALLSLALNAAGAEPISSPEVVVVGLPLRRDTFEVSEGAATARLAPGSQGDPLKVVENLPGVARPGLGSDALVLWGGAPEDTRSYIDGVEVPTLFHYGAIRSVISGDLLQSIALTPGAYGVDFGRGTGGVLRVNTRDLPEAWSAQLEASTLDASGAVSAPIGNSVRLAAAARFGWVDRLYALFQARDTRFFALPKYHDVQAKAQWTLSHRESISLVALDARDVITHATPSTEAPSVRRDSRSFDRVYARYVHALEDGSRVEVTPWFGPERRLHDATFGNIDARLHEQALRWGLRAEYRSPLSDVVALNLGTDVSGNHSSLERDGSLTVPAREGDPNIFGQPPADDLQTDSWQTAMVDLAAYASVDIRTELLRVSPGARFDGYLLETSRQTPRIGQTPAIGSSRLVPELQPRIQAALRLSARTSLLAALGSYSQPPSPADLSAVFGSPTLGPEQSLHFSVGESVQFTRNLSLVVLGYYKATRRIAVRDPQPTPKLAQALTEAGRGLSYGVQVTLRQRPWHGFSGSFAGTLSRSERWSPGTTRRLFDYDQPLLLALTLEKALDDWHFGLRLRAASGSPRTPVIGVTFNASAVAYEPTLGARNSLRLPEFFQLDARVDRVFTLNQYIRLRLLLDALNLTNHANAEEFSYNADYTERAPIRGLPLIVALGARLEL